MKVKDKKVYLEVLRVISIFLVLYCHTGVDAVSQYTVTESTGSFCLALGMRGFSFLCNTSFFLISGALLLPKEESVKKVLGRVAKFAVVILVFSVLQFLYTYWKNPAVGIDVAGYLREIYDGPVITQYWFLYAYLGLLISLPLLRALAKGMEEKHYLYLFGVYLMIQFVLPLMESVLDLGDFGVSLPLFSEVLVVPLMGHFVENVAWERISEKKNLILVNVAGALALFINIGLVAYKNSMCAPIVQYNGLVLLTALALYIDVKILCIRFGMPEWLKKVFMFLGNGVFGVFLLEPQLREGFHFIYDVTEPYITWLPATILWLGAAVFVGCVIMNVLKRVPGVKKLF